LEYNHKLEDYASKISQETFSKICCL